MTDSYPDISDVIARKAAGRAEVKRMSFGEKIELMEALRERLAPFKAMREARQKKADRSRGRLIVLRSSPCWSGL